MLQIADITKSMAFYTQIIGMKYLDKKVSNVGNITDYFFSYGTGNAREAFLRLRVGGYNHGPGQIYLAVDLDAAIQYFQQKGLTVDTSIEDWPSILDPDQNRISFGWGETVPGFPDI